MFRKHVQSQFVPHIGRMVPHDRSSFLLILSPSQAPIVGFRGPTVGPPATVPPLFPAALRLVVRRNRFVAPMPRN